ncbi:MAG: hypothetical protein V5A34_08935 [Halapricum sp.]
MSNPSRSSERGVSTTVNYVLTLGIASLLIIGLLTAGGDFIEDTRDQAVREELEVIGQQISSDVSRADRLVVAADSSDPTVRMTLEYPDRVVGTQYRVRLDNSTNQIILESADPSISVAIGIRTETDLANSTASSGGMRLVYIGDRLEVQNV